MSSFLYMCTHAQCRVNFIHHVEFYFRFQHLITLPVYSQLWHSSQGEKSSSFCSGNIEIYILWKGRLLSKVVVNQRSSSVLYCIVLYCIVLYCIVLYCTVLSCTVLYCTVLYCTVLYCTVLYCYLLYYTILYRTVLNSI